MYLVPADCFPSFDAFCIPPESNSAVDCYLFPQAKNPFSHWKPAIVRASCYLELIAAYFDAVSFYSFPYIQAYERSCKIVLDFPLECFSRWVRNAQLKANHSKPPLP